MFAFGLRTDQLSCQQQTIARLHLTVDRAQKGRLYSELAFGLPYDDATVMLADGRLMTERQLWIESLSHNPNNGMVYSNLAYIMASGETAALGDGRVLGRKALFLEAIRCGPILCNAYSNLAGLLAPTETVVLSDGSRKDRRQLLYAALHRDPNDQFAQIALAHFLERDEVVAPYEGLRLLVNRRELLLSAASSREWNALSLVWLGLDLLRHETAQVRCYHDAVPALQTCDARELFIKAVDACARGGPKNRSLSVPWVALAAHLGGMRDWAAAAAADSSAGGAQADVAVHSPATGGDAGEADGKQQQQDQQQQDQQDQQQHNQQQQQQQEQQQPQQQQQQQQLLQQQLGDSRDDGAAANAGAAIAMVTIQDPSTVTLANGRTFTSVQLLCEALALAKFDTEWPQGKRPIDHAANCASLGEQQALVVALRANDLREFALFLLRARLAPGQTVTLPDGTLLRAAEISVC